MSPSSGARRDAVDADHDRTGLGAVGGHRGARRAAGRDLLVVGDRVLEVDHDRIGPERPDLAELAPSPPGTNSTERSSWSVQSINVSPRCIENQI